MQNKKLHESDTLQALAYENCKFSFQIGTGCGLLLQGLCHTFRDPILYILIVTSIIFFLLFELLLQSGFAD